MLQCVIYNSTHEPLAIVPARRGIQLTLKGEAVILEEDPTRRVRSEHQDLPWPKSIVLKEYRKTRAKYYSQAQLNQRNLFTRDNWTCQYCGTHALDLKHRGYLTRDHIVPLSRGGRDVWENVVAACNKCNHTKDDHLPDEVGLVLRKVPKAPTIFEIISKRSTRRHRSDRVNIHTGSL